MKKPLKILFLAAEADPFIKVGGLGDVAGSLPGALLDLPQDMTAGLRLDVRVAIPLHTVVRTAEATLRPVAEFELPSRKGAVPVQVYETRNGNVPVYFITGDPVSAAPGVYSTNIERDGEKYTFFSLAAIEMTRHLKWQPDVVHANDWHTALGAYFLRYTRKNDPFLANVRSVLSVHNMPFKGPDVRSPLTMYNLSLLPTDLPAWAQAMPLGLGLWAADEIVAVSPTYAQELLTSEGGSGLEAFMQANAAKLTGIINGLDTKSFDPENDTVIARKYSAKFIKHREENKAALQDELSLKVDKKIPLLGMVSRMDPQKGVDIALDALLELKDEPWQMILLGNGDKNLEARASRVQRMMPGKLRVVIEFDAKLARRIYAGADMFLMPSRYEPCGLSQMIAMRYGCIPIVRETGGLKDTVKDSLTGFTFREAQPQALASAIRRAMVVYHEEDIWRALQREAMAQDFSWSNSAKQYLDLYLSLFKNGRQA